MRMERNDTIHYFVDANSSAGYVDLYDQSFGGLSRVVELSDFPDETAERLLFYLSARAQEEGQFSDCTLADMRLINTNLGWEMPGTFDATFEIFDLSIKYKPAGK